MGQTPGTAEGNKINIVLLIEVAIPSSVTVINLYLFSIY